MKTILLFCCLIPLALCIYFIPKKYSEQPPADEKKTAGIGEAMDLWAAQRAYPGKTIPAGTYLEAYELFAQQANLQKKLSQEDEWKAIGPKNFGGRTLALAFNPENPATMYAGAASGGLWRSRTGGVGVNAWEYITTGFPVLGVAAIAVSSSDTNTIYIGTGEVYNYQHTGTGFAVRTTRGTYGIGILKTTDGGKTWTKSLGWELNDLKGVQDIQINPKNQNTIYAATSEGTYRSGDAGTTWQKIHPVPMATDIELHPTDTSIFFIACGNFGTSQNGIYRTTNGGKNFTELIAGLPSSFTGKTLLSVCRSQPSTLYASIADSLSGKGLYRSNNSGDTWTLINSTDVPTYQGWYSHDVAVHPDNPDTFIYVGIDTWKSSDGGKNLTQKSFWYNWDFSATPIGGPEGPPDYVHADIHHVYYHPVDHDIIYLATDGGVFRSRNGGETFKGCNGMYQTTQFYASFSNSWQDSLFAIGGMQDNATAVYEGKLNWRRVIGGDGLSTAIDPLLDEVVFGSSQYLNIQKSTDKAVNFNEWVNLPPGGTNNTNFAGPYAMSVSDPNVLYAGRDVVYKSTNGGTEWNETNTGNALDGQPVLSIAVSPTNSNLVYASTTPYLFKGSLFKSDDGGNTWTDVTYGLPDRYLMDMSIDAADNNIVYVVASGFGTAHLYKSTTGGNTWEAMSSGLPDVPTNCITIDPFNSNILYLGNDLGVYVSIDAGKTWQPFTDGLQDATMVMDISISPSNKKLRVATHGKGIWERKILQLPTSVSTYSHLSISLRQNVPNPFTEETTISYSLNKPEHTTVKVYDAAGKLLEVLVDEVRPPGNHQLKFNSKGLKEGLYYYTLATGGLKKMKRMVVMR